MVKEEKKGCDGFELRDKCSFPWILKVGIGPITILVAGG